MRSLFIGVDCSLKLLLRKEPVAGLLGSFRGIRRGGRMLGPGSDAGDAAGCWDGAVETEEAPADCARKS